MAASQKSAAVSHVGKIRANNQDSGYAGANLFVVADGMGGHAGGDVASAIAIRRITEIDRQYTSAHDAVFALQSALIAANSLLAETVFEHNELTGMGTTVSGFIRVGHQIALAHIGDSRIYRLRGGTLEQISADHTFVQRLVDSGRITPEEAAERLVKESLDQGAPDNVTVVLVDIDDSTTSSHTPPVTVGSAASPLSFDSDSARRALRLPTLLLHPLKATQPDPSHFEPESDDYLDELILEDRKRARRRRATWLTALIIAVLAIVAGVVIGYQWTQAHYYVGEDKGYVAIYQGVQQGIGPIQLSSVYKKTDITLGELSVFNQRQVKATISADNLTLAKDIVERLADAGTQ